MGYWADREREPGEHQPVYEELWDRLVPPEGPAETAQGEMIRSAGRLASEYYRNGNINWGHNWDFYVGFVEYIERTLSEHGSEAFLARARPSLDAVRAIGFYLAEDCDFDFDPWDMLIHVVVEWCLAHPEPVAVGRSAQWRSLQLEQAIAYLAAHGFDVAERDTDAGTSIFVQRGARALQIVPSGTRWEVFTVEKGDLRPRLKPRFVLSESGLEVDPSKPESVGRRTLAAACIDVVGTLKSDQ